ncbi:Exportin-7-like isoform X3 [Oopsacas minuta]|uniref:Exportin-7-like isoform X3 n=1 Tax=Oopsacas minuta TaxID=111878 RepID=A0AAV7KIK7_9METZ|nr:Exportin-7-like isoform X3 [Oopsacas minuta]
MLEKQVSSQRQPLAIAERIQLKNDLFRYLVSGIAARMPHYAVLQVSGVLAKLCKFGWSDSVDGEYPFREIVNEAIALIPTSLTDSQTADINFVGLIILTDAVTYFCQSGSLRSLARHRKLLVSFRDEALFNIFTSAVEFLKDKFNTNQTQNLTKTNPVYINVGQCLQLINQCLQYDFSGLASDEQGDEMTSLQAPHSWRAFFLPQTTHTILFKLYSSLPEEIAHLAMSCLNSIAAVRRGLLDSQERQECLKEFMLGVSAILTTEMHLANPNCFHQFCRLILRLKANYQMSELVKQQPHFEQLLNQLSEFTIKIFTALAEFSPQSVYYVLSFWARQVSSMAYVRTQDTQVIKAHTPLIMEAYIMNRLQMCATHLELCEETFQDSGTIMHQLEQIATIARCDYDHTSRCILNYFDHCALSYQTALASPSTPTAEGVSSSNVVEMQLAWLVFIAGYMLGGRVSYSANDEHDMLDGEMTSRVLQLSGFMDQHRSQVTCIRLDEALLVFLDQLRKTYVNEHMQKNTTQVYDVLSRQLGITEESFLLEFYLQRIISNLKIFKDNDVILQRTLSLFNELSTGSVTPKRLIKLESSQLLINHHTGVEFPFLSYNNGCKIHLKLRLSFYKSISRLVLGELKEEESDVFDMYIAPLTVNFKRLSTLLHALPSVAAQQDETEIKNLISGLCYDLRGIVYVISTRMCYQLFFTWFFPDFISILIDCLNRWYREPEVSIPILKLLIEIGTSRCQRLTPEITSPNGFLLFKELSRAIFCYGSQILNFNDFPPDKIYEYKLKGFTSCFNVLKVGLNGGNCNFGVFQLYNDPSLENALQTFIKMIISISLDQLLQYPKLTVAYFNTLEVLCSDHIEFISPLDNQVIFYILSSLAGGIKSSDTLMCTGCCQSLDNILSHTFKQANKKVPSTTGAHLVRNIQQCKGLLQEILSSILNTVMFEECRNQWSMSRPLLSLILIDPEYFQRYQKRVIELQPTELRTRMDKCFEQLMENIEQSVNVKNKDKFTQNLNVLRRDLNNKLKEVGNTEYSFIDSD